MATRRLLGAVSRISESLVAIKPSGLAVGDLLRPGRLLTIGEEARAAVLCSRGGLFFAALLPGTPGAAPARVEDGAEAEVLLRETLQVPVGGPAGGRILDGLGHPLDGGGALGEYESLGADEALLREALPLAPRQAELKSIERSLHTGTTAIDALTPIGRGQTMLLLGERGTGKSALLLDAALAQAETDVSCVLALSDGGVERAAHTLEELRTRGLGSSLLARTTVIAPRRDCAAERSLVLSTACAVAESARAAGGHALVIADELRGICELWDTAGEAVQTFAATRGASALAAAESTRNTEQRILYGLRGTCTYRRGGPRGSASASAWVGTCQVRLTASARRAAERRARRRLTHPHRRAEYGGRAGRGRAAPRREGGKRDGQRAGRRGGGRRLLARGL